MSISRRLRGIYRLLGIFLLVGGAVFFFQSLQDIKLNHERVSLTIEDIFSSNKHVDQYIEIKNAKTDGSFSFRRNEYHYPAVRFVVGAVMSDAALEAYQRTKATPKQVIFIFRDEEKIKPDCDQSKSCIDISQSTYEGILRVGAVDDMRGSNIIKESNFYFPVSYSPASKDILVLYEGERPQSKTLRYLALAGSIAAFLLGIFILLHYLYNIIKSAKPDRQG